MAQLRYKIKKNNRLNKVSIKNRTCHYLDDKIKIEDIDFENISIDENSSRNILTFHEKKFDCCKTFSYYGS